MKPILRYKFGEWRLWFRNFGGMEFSSAHMCSRPKGYNTVGEAIDLAFLY